MLRGWSNQGKKDSSSVVECFDTKNPTFVTRIYQLDLSFPNGKGCWNINSIVVLHALKVEKILNFQILCMPFCPYFEPCHGFIHLGELSISVYKATLYSRLINSY